MERVEPKILYHDSALVVCVKQPGWLSEPSKERNLPELVSSYFRDRGQPDEIRTVHRLDKPVGGLTVLARTAEAASSLTRQIAAQTMQKEYFAVLRGRPAQTQAVLEDLLFHDASQNKTYVVDRRRKGVRAARLEYRVLDTADCESQTLTLVRVRLFTGRTHQIRAQFAARGLPLLGDVRYGSPKQNAGPALWSCMLRFIHPVENRQLSFYQRPEDCGPWDLFSRHAYRAISPFEQTEL